MTLAEFAEDLEDVLRSLCERPGRWILIAEDVAHHHHFWQALCFEDRRSTSRPCRTTTWRRMTGSPPRMRVCCESVDGRAPIFPRSTKLVEDGVHDAPGHRWGWLNRL